MEESASAEPGSRGERVRALGFDPDHLTPDEQREILELNARLDSPAGSAGAVLPPRSQSVGDPRLPSSAGDALERDRPTPVDWSPG
jgi:hypothetical protein